MGAAGGCCVAYCVIRDNVVVLSHEDKIANELSAAKSQVEERAKFLEQKVSEHITRSTAGLKALLNQFAAENFDEKTLDEPAENFCAKIKFFISEKVVTRLTEQDKEAVVILAEPNDLIRVENFNTFRERIFCNAVKDLISRINFFYRQQEELVEKIFEGEEKFNDAREKISDALTAENLSICDELRKELLRAREAFDIKSIRLRDLAEAFGFTVTGDDEREIFSLKYAHEADENSLAIIFSDRDILTTAAQSVLTEPRLSPAQKNFLHCGFRELHTAIIKIARLMIAEGFYPDYEKIFPQTEKNHSMFGANVTVGEGTFIAPFVSVGEDVTFGKNCRIESGVFIGSGTRIGDGVKILSGSRVGVNCHYHFEEGGRHRGFCGVGRTVIGDGVEIGANSVIQRGSFSDTVIGAGTVVGNLVEIAHDVKIGAGCLIVSQVGICGNVTIGARVQIFGQAGIKDWVTVGDGAIVLAKSRVTKNIRAGQKVSGAFGREHAAELRRFAKLKKIIGEE